MRLPLARLTLVASLSMVLSLPALAQRPVEEPPPTYEGRNVAHVMSYLGAPWLERAGRDAEEDTTALLLKMNIQPGQNVADIGCGSGYYTRRMAAAVGEEGAVFAVDVQPEMLEILKTKVADSELAGRIIPVLGRAGEPHLPQGEIDWILLVDVYHEFQEPALMLAQMRNALAPGGRIALAEYRLNGGSAAHIKLEHRMSVEQVLKEWQPAGFELVELWEELPTQHLFIFQKRED